MGSIGNLLGEARRDAGMSVEDVSHGTHIHANMIRNIEANDLSGFASVTYARSFIRKYAQFLKVELGDAMEALDSSPASRLGDSELMGEMKKTIKKDHRFRLERTPNWARRRVQKPGGAPVLLNLVLVFIILAMGVFYILGYNASSPEDARQEIAEGIAKATPFVASETTEEAFPEFPLADGAGASSEAKDSSSEEAGDSTKEPNSTVSGDGIEKPTVVWDLDTRGPSPLAGSDSLRVRETPDMGRDLERQHSPIPTFELPALRDVLEDPNLRASPPRVEFVPGTSSDETGETTAEMLRAVPTRQVQ